MAMSWVKLDDAFPDHRKFLRAGPLAGYLNLSAIAWSNRNGTDGLIPREQVARLITGLDRYTDNRRKVRVDALAAKLVEVGLWELRDDGDYEIHDYLDFQFSLEEMRRRSAKKAAAGRKGAEAKWRSHGNRHGKPMAGAMAEPQQTDGPTPTPTPKTSPEEVTEKEQWEKANARAQADLERQAAEGEVWAQYILDSQRGNR
jgi:hypothetical protein